MFHAIAPTSAPNTTRWSTIAGSMMPLPMVVATATPKTRNATKLKNAAQTTAWCGRIAPVETIVAIEFAASWKPLRKSNASATTTRKTTISRVIAGARSAPLRRSRG